MLQKIEFFHDFLTFLESDQNASRKRLGCLGRVQECLRVLRNEFWTPTRQPKTDEHLEIFRFFYGGSEW